LLVLRSPSYIIVLAVQVPRSSNKMTPVSSSPSLSPSKQPQTQKEDVVSVCVSVPTSSSSSSSSSKGTTIGTTIGTATTVGTTRSAATGSAVSSSLSSSFDESSNANATNNTNTTNNNNTTNTNNNYGLNINDFIKTHYGAISGNAANGEEDTLSLLAANAKDHARALGVCSDTASVNSYNSSTHTITNTNTNTNLDNCSIGGNSCGTYSKSKDSGSTNYGTNYHYNYGTTGNYNGNYNGNPVHNQNHKQWTLRKIALDLSLYCNVLITLTKLIAYCQTLSLSVLAALLDSVLDVVSQVVLNYTEKHSTMQRSSALYPAGASRLEPIGVLTCASLMGMASFEVLKESLETLLFTGGGVAYNGNDNDNHNGNRSLDFDDGIHSAVSMGAIVLVKLLLLWLCNYSSKASGRAREQRQQERNAVVSAGVSATTTTTTTSTTTSTTKNCLQHSDPTLEAVAQDHKNDALSNGVSAVCLLLALYSKKLWWCDGVGAILISFYIIYSWFETGKEQIEHLTGKSAPDDFLQELTDLANTFDDRLLVVDTCRAYHFGPKFLVELEVVMPVDTLLKESHDLGMELQYEIEAREEVERCFVHIDYESREYDEHVVSKVPELREHLLRHRTSRLGHGTGTSGGGGSSSV